MNTLRIAIAALILAPCLASAAPDCSPRKPERFVDFFPTFSETKGFALERTVLPLPLLHWSDGVDTEGRPLVGPRKSLLSAAEYWRWPSLNEYMRRNDLLANVKSQTSVAAVVDIYKDGSEGTVSFHFKTKAGCWYLWQYEVHTSNS